MINVVYDIDPFKQWFTEEFCAFMRSYNHAVHYHTEALFLALIAERLQQLYLIALSETCHAELSLLYRIVEPFLSTDTAYHVDKYLYQTFSELKQTRLINLRLSYIGHMSSDLLLIFE